MFFPAASAATHADLGTDPRYYSGFFFLDKKKETVEVGRGGMGCEVFLSPASALLFFFRCATLHGSCVCLWSHWLLCGIIAASQVG